MLFEETVVLAFLNELQKLQNRAACYLEACPGLCFAMVIWYKHFQILENPHFQKRGQVWYIFVTMIFSYIKIEIGFTPKSK